MALLELKYRSPLLKMEVSVSVILPEPAKPVPENGCPVLYLYHGLTDDQSCWLRQSSVERYASAAGIALVMPAVGRSWYTDTAYGAPYFSFVTKELPQVCRQYFRGLSQRREDTSVCGVSMGGYGALKAALSCPEVFGSCISLSGSLDVTRKGRVMSKEFLQEWKSIFGAYPAELEGSRHDLLALAARDLRDGVPLPRLYLWCGTEDHLIGVNRDFHARLEELRIPHHYGESEGDHSWKWWDPQIKAAIRWLLEEKSPESTENNG